MHTSLSSIRNVSGGAFGLAAVLVLALALVSADVLAQSRRVAVNGELMSDAQVAELARTNCAGFASGAYWIDSADSSWGFADNPQLQGIVGERCNSATSTKTNASNGASHAAARRHGPYATMRRAREVADQLRARGMRTVALHNTDGYWVDARR